MGRETEGNLEKVSDAGESRGSQRVEFACVSLTNMKRRQCGPSTAK